MCLFFVIPFCSALLLRRRLTKLYCGNQILFQFRLPVGSQEMESMLHQIHQAISLVSRKQAQEKCTVKYISCERNLPSWGDLSFVFQHLNCFNSAADKK